MTPEERIADLEALIVQQREQIAQQQEQIAQLNAYVRELEGRLAKDGQNYSKPPSSDGLLTDSVAVLIQAGAITTRASPWTRAGPSAGFSTERGGCSPMRIAIWPSSCMRPATRIIPRSWPPRRS